ncbi:MAG: hypothetical protein KF788_09010 [Piscinibacter sp.]|nr:hypothetical protein [Piscinibacter sp.]
MTTRTLLHRRLHFRDAAEPQDVQAGLERAIGAVFVPIEGRPSARAAQARVGTLRFRVELSLDAVLEGANVYRLAFDVSAEGEAADDAALRRHAENWIGLWTGRLAIDAPPPSGAGSVSGRQALVARWADDDAQLADAAATQQAIVSALRAGAAFSTAHKEGGTTIRFDGRAYVRADYGESSEVTRFETDAQLLAFLRRFFHHEVSFHAPPGGVSEAHAWQLILRRLERHRRGPAPGAAALGHFSRLGRLGTGARLAAVFGSVVLVFAVIAGVSWWQHTRQRAAAPPAPGLARVPPPPTLRGPGETACCRP